jgi:hypothetical protein
MHRTPRSRCLAHQHAIHRSSTSPQAAALWTRKSLNGGRSGSLPAAIGAAHGRMTRSVTRERAVDSLASIRACVRAACAATLSARKCGSVCRSASPANRKQTPALSTRTAASINFRVVSNRRSCGGVRPCAARTCNGARIDNSGVAIDHGFRPQASPAFGSLLLVSAHRGSIASRRTLRGSSVDCGVTKSM